jgi:hypothetical protein
MKALEKTGNITRGEVLRAANDQLRALGSQREVFAGAVSRKREELASLGGGTGRSSTAVLTHLSPVSINITGMSSMIGYLRSQPGSWHTSQASFTSSRRPGSALRRRVGPETHAGQRRMANRS